MFEVLLWIYIINAVLVINHEIESAYWKEWDIFKLPGRITGFLLMHFPVLFFVLLGLILVSRHSHWGLAISLLLSCGGMFAFVAHTYFLKKGRQEFRLPISTFILVATLIFSVVQAILSIYILVVY